MMRIIVDSEEDKQKLLEESEYIHYLSEIDSDKAGVLMHIYMNPDMIEVENETSDTDSLEEFIEYCCSTGKTTNTTLFTREELIEIENKAAGGSDKKFEKVIRKIWKKKHDSEG